MQMRKDSILPERECKILFLLVANARRSSNADAKNVSREFKWKR